MDLDDTLCYCFHISQRKIVNYIRRTRPARVSQISECFGAGSGCGWCIPYLTQLHQEIMGDAIVEAGDVTPEEYESLRKAYLEEVHQGRREPNRKGGGDPLEESFEV
ncbi:MAG: (2Fe-2S)-binding protein [Planctomycetota bacterium]